MSEVIIRPIQKKDNPHIANVIRTVLVELNLPKVGTVFEDTALDCMFETYATPKSAYFVVTNGSEILGGAGIAPLANYKGNTCELQKMYFLDALRGKGIGKKMIIICLQHAITFGFDSCYIETILYMKAAQKLMLRNGFAYLDETIGHTGHFSCPSHMPKKL